MKMSLTLGAETIDLDVVFRKRKTMEIQIHPPRKVRVLVPSGTTRSIIMGVVKSKESWINKKLGQLRAVGCPPVNRKLVTGEKLLYLGRKYLLEVKINSNVEKISVKLHEGKLQVFTPVEEEGKIKQALENWYRKRAEERIQERVQYYSIQLKKYPSEIKVKNQKRRWGSCTGAGKLLFNWRGIMAPDYILDYIVVHEMCHLLHMNHSIDFWNLVGSILPDYKGRRQWLRQYGVLLDL